MAAVCTEAADKAGAPREPTWMHIFRRKTIELLASVTLLSEVTASGKIITAAL